MCAENVFLSVPEHRSLDDAGSEVLITPKPCRGSHAAVMNVDPKFLPGSCRRQKRGRLFSFCTLTRTCYSPGQTWGALLRREISLNYHC